MKRRREHGECETRLGGRGCLVLGTPVCEVRKEKSASKVLKRKLGALLQGSAMQWWILVALMGMMVALASAWVGTQTQGTGATGVEV